MPEYSRRPGSDPGPGAWLKIMMEVCILRRFRGITCLLSAGCHRAKTHTPPDDDMVTPHNGKITHRRFIRQKAITQLRSRLIHTRHKPRTNWSVVGASCKYTFNAMLA